MTEYTFHQLADEALDKVLEPTIEWPKVRDEHFTLTTMLTSKYTPLLSQLDNFPDQKQVYQDVIKFFRMAALNLHKACLYVIDKFLFVFTKKSNQTILLQMARNSIKGACFGRGAGEELQVFLTNWLLDYGDPKALPTDRFAALYDVVEELDIRLLHDYNQIMNLPDSTP